MLTNIFDVPALMAHPCANSAFTGIHASNTWILVIIPAFNGAGLVFDLSVVFIFNKFVYSR